MIKKATITIPPAYSKDNAQRMVTVDIKDTFVTATTDSSAKWAVGRTWASVAHWYEKRGAVIKES